MPSKKFSISNAKWTRLKIAINARHAIPMIQDPKDEDNEIPEFTEAEWVFEYVKRLLAREVKAYENDRQGRDNATALDNDIFSIT